MQIGQKKQLQKNLHLILLALSLLISSCNRNSKDKETNNKIESKIAVGYIPIADCSQLYVAIEKGFFTDEGLNIEAKEFQGGPQILEALKEGKTIQIGFSNLISLVNANANGINYRAVTGGPVEDEKHIENAIMTLKNDSIKTAKDLEGKIVAVNARKNIIELLFREYMQKNGANPDLVQVVELKFPQMQQALLAKQISAMCIIEPFVTIAKKDEKIKILSNYFTEVLPRIEISSYHADLSWIEKNKEVIEKFRKAMITSTKYCNDNPVEVRKILIKYAKGKPEILKEATLPNFTERISSDNLQVLIEKMQKNAWLNKPIVANNLIYQN